MIVKIKNQLYPAELIMIIREKGCGYMDNSPLLYELPTYPQLYCYYFLNFLKQQNKDLNKDNVFDQKVLISMEYL